MICMKCRGYGFRTEGGCDYDCEDCNGEGMTVEDDQDNATQKG